MPSDMSTLSNTNTKIADQAWIALALLTRESASHTGFSASSIKERIRKEFGSVSPRGRNSHRPAQPCNKTGKPEQEPHDH